MFTYKTYFGRCITGKRSESVSHSVMSDSVTPWTIARQAPLSMEFSRQEYWSGYPFPSPWGLPNPGIEPRSPTLKILYYLSHQGSPKEKNRSPSNTRVLPENIFYIIIK